MCRCVPPVGSKTTGPNNSGEDCRRGHVGHAVSAQRVRHRQIRRDLPRDRAMPATHATAKALLKAHHLPRLDQQQATRREANPVDVLRLHDLGFVVGSQLLNLPESLTSSDGRCPFVDGTQGRKSFASATHASERHVPWRQGSEARR